MTDIRTSGTGYTAMGEITNAMKIEELVRAMGCKNVRLSIPITLETRETIKWALNIDEASVIIASTFVL